MKQHEITISINCTQSLRNKEDITVGYSVRLGYLFANGKSEYSGSDGESLSKEFLKALDKIQELAELQAKNSHALT